jgi:hypothetical protein
VRVTDQAPPLDAIASRLRARRYRVTLAQAPQDADAPPPGWLTADRAPWALLLSLLLHVGLLLAVLGILVNSTLGWDVPRQPIDADTPVTFPRSQFGLALQAIDVSKNSATFDLQGERQTVVLPLGQSVPLGGVRSAPLSCCLTLRLADITPGYRISAADVAGKPLTITASSYADPAREVMLTFRRDEPGRLIAIEQARMALLVSEDKGGRVQVYGLPGGNVLTDTLIRPTVAVSGTMLQFKPTTSAVIAAQYRPGDIPLWVGGVLALIGLVGVVVWPIRRLIIRHHGHWTEFYASGRGVRQVVRDLLRNASN